MIALIKRVRANYIFARNETLFCSELPLTFKEWVSCVKRACTFRDIAK